MKLFCSGCGCYFDDKETIYKDELVDSAVAYHYYHKQCRPAGAKIIDKGNLKHLAT